MRSTKFVVNKQQFIFYLITILISFFISCNFSNNPNYYGGSGGITVQDIEGYWISSGSDIPYNSINDTEIREFTNDSLYYWKSQSNAPYYAEEYGTYSIGGGIWNEVINFNCKRSLSIMRYANGEIDTSDSKYQPLQTLSYQLNFRKQNGSIVEYEIINPSNPDGMTIINLDKFSRVDSSSIINQIWIKIPKPN